jgi:hypothetical protein
MNKIIFVIVFALGIASPSSSDDVESIARDLGSENRSTRIATLEKVAEMRSLPPQLVVPVADAIRKDIDAVFTANGARTKKGGKLGNSRDLKLEPIPGDTTIPRIKADPARFYGVDFTLIVGLTISDHYPSRGAYDREGFCAFSIDQFASDGSYQSGASGYGYLLRGLSLGLTEYAAGAVEEGASHILARIKCVIPLSFKSLDDPERLIHIKDWQLYDFDAKKWKLWALEGVIAGLRALENGGMPAARELVSFVGAEKVMASKLVDEIVRSSAGVALTEIVLGADERATIAEKVTARRQEVARWGDAYPRDTILKECDKILKAIQPKPTDVVQPKTAKAVDPATRAAAILKAAKNLEKAGKPQPAIENYRRIVKDFPETPSARAATARLKELGVK